MIRIAAIILVAWLGGIALAAAPATRPSAEGRFIYANDDDWDWASPLKCDEPCGLAEYGRMDWSALDWMEEGLGEVRCIVYGTMPAGYLTLPGLKRIRADARPRSIVVEQPSPGRLPGMLSAADAPNVIVMMQDQEEQFASLSADDLDALAGFLKRGGRLLVLDDWGIYRPVLDRMMGGEKARPEPLKPHQLAASVAELVRKLADDDFTVRDKASAELVMLGEPAAKLLWGLKPDDPEARHRIATIISRIIAPVAQLGEEGALKNEEMDILFDRYRKHSERISMRQIQRNAQQQPGRAMVLVCPKK